MNWLIMLVIAVVFGAAAVFVANLWLQQQRQQHARVQPAPGVQTATIVVAAGDLPFGKHLTPQDLKEIPWPKASIPNGYFGKISDITGASRRIVLVPLSPNEPVLKWKITGPNQRGSLSAVVKPGMRAVAIPVNAVVGVAGFVLPGDHVDVLLTRNDKQNKEVTDVLLQDVKVLAVNQLADEKANKPTVSSVATLEVTTTDAQKLALAQRVGGLSLSLRPAGSTQRAPTRRIVAAELTSSTSAYQEEFAARKAAQEAIDRRLKSLESNVTHLGKEVKATGSEAEKALNQREAELRQRIADLQAELNKKVLATGSQAEEAMNQRAAILKKQIADLQVELEKLNKKVQVSSSQTEEAMKQRAAVLKKQIDDLQAELNKKVQATGSQAEKAMSQREAVLKKQIADLQTELEKLNKKVQATGSQTEEAMKQRAAALRKQIADLQAELNKKLQASGTQTEEAMKQREAELKRQIAQLQAQLDKKAQVPEPKAAKPEKSKIVDETMTVDVIRGLRTSSYVVPREVTAE